MSRDRIWILLGKELSGDISSAELSELEALLKDDPEAAASRDLAATIWQTPIQEVNDADNSKERIWNAVSPQLQVRRHRPLVRRLVAAAAAAAVLAVAWAGWQLIGPTGPVLQQLSSAPGGKSRVLLPDRSTVWLHS